ncbi:porin [Collimonas sp. H4R21]|uniref:Porin n=1 Tax=Collimonas rhizosphaerae TaxID=3126357 RepID=A0ABU9PUQ2_9BURK
MKKSLIALAVLGAIAGAAQAQSSVTIYGIVDTGIVYTSKAAAGAGTTGSKFSVNSGVIQGSRLGFKGVEDLGGGLKALFQLEAGFNNDNGALNGQDSKSSTTLFRRKSVVGLGGNFGSVLLGRQTDILDDVSQWTSVQDFGGVTGSVGHNLDRLEGTRTNNSIRYNTPDFAGFTGSAIYGFGEAAGKTSSGQSFGLGGQYANGPLGLFAAYYQSKLGTVSATGTSNASDASLLNNSSPTFNNSYGAAGDTALKTFSLGASYQVGPARLYGNWSRVKQPLAVSSTTLGLTAINAFGIGGTNNSKADIFELGVNYAVTAPLHLLASVQYNKLTFADANSPKGKLTQINLGTDYFLSKRTDLYAFVSNLRAKDAANPGVFGDGIGSNTDKQNQTAVAVGIRHKF